MKEFNARTTKVRPNVLLQTTITPRTDKSYKFTIRSPEAQWFIKRAARVHTGSSAALTQPVSYITTKELFHIAKSKSMDPNLLGIPTYNVVRSLMGTAEAMGIRVSKDPHPDWPKRDIISPGELDSLRKEHKLRNKASKKAKR